MPQCNSKVKYETEEFKEFIEDFKNSEMKSSDWDKTDDITIKIKKHIKDYYIRNQNYTCPYCLQKFEVKHGMSWDIEHIIPKDKFSQFLFTEENLCVACKDCNREKWNKSIINISKNKKNYPKKSESDKFLIVHPHYDEYESNINKLQLSSALHFIPKTLKGLKTIEVCGLLRFIYKYAEYNEVSVDNTADIIKLSSLIQESESMERVLILQLLQHKSKEMEDSMRPLIESEILN